MATIVIENVPQEALNKFGSRVSYQHVSLRKKRQDITAQLQTMLRDKDNTSSKTMNSQDFLEEIKTW